MTAHSATQKILAGHLVRGELSAGEEIEISVDQTLLHDVGGTLIMLELEALGISRVVPQPSVAYADHNLLQLDERNADDHRFLRTAAARLGVYYSPPGNGISHPVHAQRFGRPGATLLGCDSHTPAAGALGMFAVAAGGLAVALAMAGTPLTLTMPKIWGIELVGRLPAWVSAKDVILELLRRHGVQGGNGRVVEYFGEGLDSLSVMDRHVIANMGTELGAVTSVFPSDDCVRAFLALQGRSPEWRPLAADAGAAYDVVERIDLGRLAPLIALPHSPGNVVPVAEVEGLEVAQVIVGSSANPGFRDYAVVANTLKHAALATTTTLDVNPSSRQVSIDLADAGLWSVMSAAGARINQAGCLGCCGNGQAPATGVVSLRTFPRNFRGRSGVADDQVFLCSPETAAAAAVTGRITDPRRLSDELGVPYEPIESTRQHMPRETIIAEPHDEMQASKSEVLRGPHIKPLPRLEPLPDTIRIGVALKVSNDVSTDDIMPAGAAAMALRSDIPAISRYVFQPLDTNYVDRVLRPEYAAGHAVVAAQNYGQGSAREHAAIAPRHLGLRAVLAMSFARIHMQNLATWGVLPLELSTTADYEAINVGDTVEIVDVRRQLVTGQTVDAVIQPGGRRILLRHHLTSNQVEQVLDGGAIPHYSQRARPGDAPATGQGQPLT